MSPLDQPLAGDVSLIERLFQQRPFANVEALRDQMLAGTKDAELRTAMLRGGFNSDFWAALKAELLQRRKIAENACFTCSPWTEEGRAGLARAQSDLAAIDTLLGIELQTAYRSGQEKP